MIINNYYLNINQKETGDDINIVLFLGDLLIGVMFGCTIFFFKYQFTSVYSVR